MSAVKTPTPVDDVVIDGPFFAEEEEPYIRVVVQGRNVSCQRVAQVLKHYALPRQAFVVIDFIGISRQDDPALVEQLFWLSLHFYQGLPDDVLAVGYAYRANGHAQKSRACVFITADIQRFPCFYKIKLSDRGRRVF